MKRLIYAEDVKELIDEWLDIVGYCTIGKGLSYYGELLGCIEDAPTIEAVPVVHGEWTMRDGRLACSRCGMSALQVMDEDNWFRYVKSFYCPNCGAKMTK